MAIYKIDHKTNIDEFGVDHTNFSLRDEIEYNFMRVKENRAKRQHPVKQIAGAVADMTRNYIDMIQRNIIGSDDYFHCKANYEAADRGPWGQATAQWLGDKKEDFDYYKNRFRGLTPSEAYIDKLHDKKINEIGRQRAQSGVYSNSKEACASFRVKGINEKY